MSTGYLLLVLTIIIAAAATSYGRIIYAHDHNQLDVSDKHKIRHEEISITNNDIETSESAKNSLITPDNWKKGTKEFGKKKVWKSNKKFVKRNVDSRTQDFKNALDFGTLKMPEEPLRKNHPKVFDGLYDDYQELGHTPSPKETFIDSKDFHNEYEYDGIKNMDKDKIAADYSIKTLPEERSSIDKKVNMKQVKVAGDLEYYLGEPTVGHKLSGPNIKELMEKFKERDALRNENMSTGSTRISDSVIRSEKSILSQKRAKERIALQGNSNVDVIMDELRDRPYEQTGNGNKENGTSDRYEFMADVYA